MESEKTEGKNERVKLTTQKGEKVGWKFKKSGEAKHIKK